jgi:cytidylate kinase
MAILTTSREFGSGNMEIVRAIMVSFHYEYVDKVMLFEEIRAIGGEWERWAKELDESSPSFFEKYDRSFKGFAALLQSIQLRYALKDNVILRGRGANFLMEGIPHAYRIRVVGSLEDRIERVTARDLVDQETARWLIEKSDRERAGFVHALYDKDMSDPQSYDAVFDKGRQPIDEIIEIVKHALLARDELKTDAAQKLLSMRRAAARIKARIIMDPCLYIPVLEVDCTETEIAVRGIVRTSIQFEGIAHAARELAGDLPLSIELHYRV